MILIPLEKGFVKEKNYVNKHGTSVHVSAHFNKRPPAQEKHRHTRRRFIDHSGSSAKKAIADLHSKIAHHTATAKDAQRYLDQLSPDHKDNSGLSHGDKRKHLEQEIKNQKAHAESAERKVGLINNRYAILQHKSAQKNINSSNHSEGQKDSLNSIHDHFISGKSHLRPTGNIKYGKEHILVETKHRKTGEKKHVAIDKNGNIHDPKDIDFKETRKVAAKVRPENNKVEAKPVQIGKKPATKKSFNFTKEPSPKTIISNSNYWVGGKYNVSDKDLIKAYAYSELANYLIRNHNKQKKDWSRNETITLTQTGGEDHLKNLKDEISKRDLHDSYAIDIDFSDQEESKPKKKITAKPLPSTITKRSAETEDFKKGDKLTYSRKSALGGTKTMTGTYAGNGMVKTDQLVNGRNEIKISEHWRKVGAQLGNKNAWKGGPKVEPKKVRAKKPEETKKDSGGGRLPNETTKQWLNRLTGKDPDYEPSKSEKLRKKADKLAKEAHEMLKDIPAGQPIHSVADRNLRERSGEKMRASSELRKQADQLEPKKVRAVKSEELKAITKSAIGKEVKVQGQKSPLTKLSDDKQPAESPYQPTHKDESGKPLHGIFKKDFKKTEHKMYINNGHLMITYKYPKVKREFSSPMLNDENMHLAGGWNFESKSDDKTLLNRVINKKKPSGFIVEEDISKIKEVQEKANKAGLETKINEEKRNDQTYYELGFTQKGTFGDHFDIDALVKDYEKYWNPHNKDFVLPMDDFINTDQLKGLKDKKLSSFLSFDYGKTDKSSEDNIITGLLLGYPIETTVAIGGIAQNDKRDKNEPEATEDEKTRNRSEGMKGNKNAYKGGPKEEPKKVRAKKNEDLERIKKGEKKEPETHLEKQDEIDDKLDAGTATLDEVKEHFKRVVDNEDDIKLELNKLNKKQLSRLGSLYQSQSDPKKRFVESAYSTMVSGYAHIKEGSLRYSYGQKLSDVIQEKVNSLTKEDLKKYSEKRTKAKEAQKKRIEGLRNPKTLDEFKNFNHYFGEGKLNPEQQKSYDELHADDILAKRKVEDERKSQISKVELGDTGMSVEKIKHTKTGEDLSVVKMSDRVSKETYRELNGKAKQLGGYYSRYSRGFIFKNDDSAKKFAGLSDSDQSNKEEKETKKLSKKETVVNKLNSMADSLENKGTESLNQERTQNTARQARMAASSEGDARAKINMARVMRGISDGIKKGDVKLLSGIQYKTDIDELKHLSIQAKLSAARNAQEKAGGSYSKFEEVYHGDNKEEHIYHAKYPFPTMYKDTFNAILRDIPDTNTKGMVQDTRAIKKMFKGKKGAREFVDFKNMNVELLRRFLGKAKTRSNDSYAIERVKEDLNKYDRLQRMGLNNASLLRGALREYHGISNGTVKEAPDRIKEIERGLIGKKIDGFFPTPKKVIENNLLEKADIQKGMTVLEPSAGKGDIADMVKGKHPDVNVATIEINSGLRNILKEKGHDIVDNDFLQHENTYDRIVMNPPFEKGMDIDHVKHAHSLLNGDGKLVSVMSSGPFFRTDKKSQAFRDWVDTNGGTVEDLPEGTFKGPESFRQTGVSSKVLTMNKQEAVPEKMAKSVRTVEETKLLKLKRIRRKKRRNKR